MKLLRNKNTELNGPVVFQLPSSKSLSNRALIIRALTDVHFPIANLSEADDTRHLLQLIDHPAAVEFCGAGGTTLRFLLALRAAQNHSSLLSGSERLQQRPLAPLVDALRSLGADIDYVQQEGFAPVQLNGGVLSWADLKINAEISSQFITALLLIGPAVSGGLLLSLEGVPVSSSYIRMTVELMRYFGVEVSVGEKVLVVPQAKYQPREYRVSADWSAAAFAFAFAALMPGVEIFLPGLKADDGQGDAVLLHWMHDWGVSSEVLDDGLKIFGAGIPVHACSLNMIDHPDLAQAFAVMAAVAGRELHLSGLSTLPLKETDRLLALKTELEKVGASVVITSDSLSVMKGVEVSAISAQTFETYEDHRMVMALSLLASTGQELTLSDIRPVSKSFPGFFTQLELLGYSLA
jgi:3-phosphoshikimate 1-carboxyvinyltransferase